MGVFSEESLRHQIPMLGGQRQTPMSIRTLTANSAYWKATDLQLFNLASFLLKASYSHKLGNAPGGSSYLTAEPSKIHLGKIVFADNCAACHSSKAPGPAPTDVPQCSGPKYLDCWERYWTWAQTDDFKEKMRQIVLADDFLEGNYLSNNIRVPVTLLRTNVCVSLSANALGGNIWDNFSSDSYKQLPSVGSVTVYDPFTGEPRPFLMPAGGRGYTRVPSLVSIWSNAPYLLDKSLGTFDPNPSVQARMASFENSISMLLWPEKRNHDTVLGNKIPGVIDRTTTSSWVKMPGSYLPYFIKQSEVTIQNDLSFPVPDGIPVNLLANVGLLPDTENPVNRVEYEKAVATLVNGLNDLPQDATIGIVRSAYANLAGPLSALSKCPDFVVGRGHYFGESLRDEEKRALIEFLKTF
jgi:hypothetical protein